MAGTSDVFVMVSVREVRTRDGATSTFRSLVPRVRTSRSSFRLPLSLESTYVFSDNTLLAASVSVRRTK